MHIHIINPFELHHSVELSVFTLLCNHHFPLVSRLFHYPQNTFQTHQVTFLLLLFPPLGVTTIDFLSLYICLFWIYYRKKANDFFSVCLISPSISFFLPLPIKDLLLSKENKITQTWP